MLGTAGSAPMPCAPRRASGSLRMPPPQPISRMRRPLRLSSRLGSRSNRRQAASLMNPSPTGVNLCTMPILPPGSHQSAARAAKRATSAGSTVGLSVAVVAATVILLSDLSAGIGLIRPFPTVRLRAQIRTGMYSRLFARGLARKPAPFTATPAARDQASMARLVMKFGGTSVADIDRIRNVARHVEREVAAGHEVAVVVSAMAGTTNRLAHWCREAPSLHAAREYDAVVASGEQVTAGLLAITLVS